jgi:hypothetical protein
MLAHRRSRFMLTSSQPVHVQHDLVGEGRDRVFTRGVVGTSRVKTLAVSVDQPIHPMDIACRTVEARQKNDCFKKFEDFRAARASVSGLFELTHFGGNSRQGLSKFRGHSIQRDLSVDKRANMPLDRLPKDGPCAVEKTRRVEIRAVLDTVLRKLLTRNFSGYIKQHDMPQITRLLGLSRRLLKFSGGSVDAILTPFCVRRPFCEPVTA